ncbi:MAG: LacI family DNA-binding transcriptional regulator [Acidobacteriaceae bacterium]
MDILTVARRAGVSSATVSRVLNSPSKVRESTAARVRKAIEDLDYVPNSGARLLRSGRSNMYGIIVSDIRNPFFPDLIEHFESLATQHGIHVTFVNTGYSEERLLSGVKGLVERGIDGIAVLTSEVSAKGLEKIREAGTPVVFLNQPSIAEDFHNISVDYLRGFRSAVEHLHMLGHRAIGFVAGPSNLSSAVRRKRAFLDAVKASRLPFRDEWMFQGDHRITGGQFAAERLFAMKKAPTAVVCSNDMTAIGLLHTANRIGRKVPQELSLIGFDDLFLSEIVQPALTTLHLSRQEIATRAFFALHGEKETGSGSARTATVSPRLVIRASTGVAP